MAEPEKMTKDSIKDDGLDVGAEKLSSERIEKEINRVLKGESGARLKAYVETCIHCGLCSEACHYFLSRDKDPQYSPVGKVKQTLWEMLKKKGRVDADVYQARRSHRFNRMQCLQALRDVLPFRYRYRLYDVDGAGESVICLGSHHFTFRIRPTAMRPP